MALYQPSNITPSTFAGIGGGVIDATDNVSISWQVNGTSAMTGFSIAIYQNNSSSTLVGTFSADLSPAFYGTDANGNPVFYVYEPGVTWASKNLSIPFFLLSNSRPPSEQKLSIIQYNGIFPFCKPYSFIILSLFFSLQKLLYYGIITSNN